MFDGRYRAVIADTEESKSIHYRLRYQIYCLEKGFEPSERFENQQEIDAYDDRSVHFLVQHQASGRWIAAARLVLGPPDRLPIAQVARFSLAGIDIERKRFAELSRVSVLRAYRNHGRASFVNEPELLLGIIRAARDYSEQSGLDYWLFLCRRSVMRILGQFGLEMAIVGDPCRHRGIRYPYLGDLANGFDAIAHRSPEVHAMFSRRDTLIPYSRLHPSCPTELAA